MPKMKSNRGALKRLKVTKSGKLMRKRANASHILTKKTRKRKRRLRKETVVDKTNAKNIRKLIQA